MFRSSKLFNLSRNFKFQNKTNVHHKLCLTLDHKLIANQYLNRHLQTLSVRHYSSMFSHGNTDKTDENTWYFLFDVLLFHTFLTLVKFQSRSNSFWKSQWGDVRRTCWHIWCLVGGNISIWIWHYFIGIKIMNILISLV